ncbi:MFS family permease [Microbacterium sp. ZKA21]|uniref:MFS transporter n=1 Tax=Microbacterium sp. ZKA21 TaxID=3381694 RepID=UPI003D1BE8BD
MSQPADSERAAFVPQTTVVSDAPSVAGGLADGLGAEADEQKRAPARNVVAVLLIALGIGFGTLMPAMVALPVVIARITPESKDVVLGAVLGLQAFLGMALAPFFGALSDRTTSRFGMRRPGIAIGGTSIVVGLVILGLATNVPMIFLGTFFMAIGSSISGASSFAVIPDSFPDRSRGKILGFKALTGSLAGLTASIIGPMLLSNQFALFGVGAGVLTVCYLIAVPLIQDRHLDRADVPKQSLLANAFSGYRFNPKSAPDFSWVFVSRFIFTLGIAFCTTFAVYFLTDELRVSAEELPPLIALNSIISLAGTAAGTLIGAFLADKVPSRKAMVMVAASILSAGAIIVAFSPTPNIFFIGTTLLALSVGLFIPTDGALVMSVLPGGNAHAAKFMAIIGIADQLPRSLGASIAPAIIAVGAFTALGGYPVLYIAGGVAALIGGFTIRMVRGAR